LEAVAAAGRGRRVLVVVAAFAATLRLLYVAEIHDHPFWRVPLVDAADYHATATQVASGAGLGPEVHYKAPAYAWLVGQLYRLTGPRLPVAYALQMVAGVLAAVLVAALGLRWFGAAAALVGGLAAGLYAPLVYFENQLLIESAALSVSVLAVWLATLAGERRGGRAAAALDTAAGATAGLALQLRPVNAALVAALLASVLLARAAWNVRLRRAACIVVPVLLLLVPTARHNRVATGRLVPISVNGGINFYIGNNPDYHTTVAIRPGLRWEELTQRCGPLDDPVRWQEGFYRASFAWMREQPGAALGLWFEKLVLFWNRREIDRNQDSAAMLGESRVLGRLALSWAAVAPLGLLGLWLARREAVRLPLHGLVAWQMLGVVAFFVTGRYRLAVVPWLGLAAGVAVQAIGRGVAERDRRRLAAHGAFLALALLLVLPDRYGIAARDFGRPDFDRAEVLGRLGDRAGALAAYESAVRRHPDDPDVQFRYGEQLHRMGRTPEALAAYERAAALAPWSYKPPLALGAARLEAGELDAAWQSLAEAARRGDPHGRTIYNMGLVRERQGRDAEALALFERSLELPDEAREKLERHLGRARTLLRLGRAAEADLAFEEAGGLAADPLVVPLARAEAALRARDPARALAVLDGIPGAESNAAAQAVRARASGMLERSGAAGLDSTAAP
jgi:tetratricopeptide (TPR) repeat protein